MACPVTSGVKGYPFEVALPAGGRVQGVVLCDHATSVDWRTRRVEFIAVAPADVLEEVTAKVQALIGGEE
jgi:mRNA interferase MazF